MSVLTRLLRYVRPEWRPAALGFLFTALYALFSGFSIGLILPIMDKVFLRADVATPAGPPLPVGEGLSDTWADMKRAWDGRTSVGAGADSMRSAAILGLTRVQNQSPPLEILMWLCGITIAAIFLKNASDFGRKVSFIRVEQGSAERLRNEMFRHVAALPLAAHKHYPSGQLLSRVVTDIELVKTFTINTAAGFLHSLFQVLVFSGIVVWASPRLSLVSVLIVPPIVLLTGRLSTRLRKLSGRAQAGIAEITSVLGEALSNIRVVKAFGAEEREAVRFGERTRNYRRSVVRLTGIESITGPLSEFWGVMIGVGVLYVGARLVLDPASDMTPGRFFVFFLALISMLHPLKGLTSVAARFQRGAAAADRVFEILDLPIETDAPNARPIAGLTGEIRFDSVGFSYEPGRPVLRDVSFVAPAGTTTALVGPSGGGKSTLIDLIARFHDPTEGSVLFDGVDSRMIRRVELRRLIGLVTQETILFNDTVAANIAYGRGDASLEEIESAARAANAEEFIRTLPGGYSARIGERGLLLSGGQRQRLAIARAILRDPSILIFDEATSSLDTESEAAIQDAMTRLLLNRTTFVIAHRLSTIMHADRILVLDQGRIVEQGTHRELLERGTLYRRLYDLQFREERAVQPPA